MSKQQIKALVEARTPTPGLHGTGIDGVQLFRIVDPLRCAPVVYEPCVIAIVGGGKEAILDGTSYRYDSRQYMCCPMSMPVEAGTPQASPEDPLLGVYVSLDTPVMTELAIEIERTAGARRPPKDDGGAQGLALADWDAAFTEALLRLLQLGDRPGAAQVLGNGRLRELYYAVLNGGAGATARRAFGVGNDIARTIAHLSGRLDQAVSVEDLAAEVGMSRAVFHRKFKQATALSPIQFVKSMRLNSAAMKIAGGASVNAAALEVGYASPSQFSREFKRLYGASPKQWSATAQAQPRPL